MQSWTRLKRRSTEFLLITGLALAILICSIPFKQEVEVTKVEEYTSSDQYHIEIGFGGPEVTWVKVMCNRTAEIRFMYHTGVWVSTKTVLLSSYRSTIASFNFKSEHSTNIIDIVSDGPILVHVAYTYLLETEINLFNRVLNVFVFGQHL